jgi:mannose-6-phosphate isomerase-like protein (cupin superfamily)
MLGQIESGKTAPTISLLWKVVQALDVPFSALYAEDSEGDISIQKVKSSKILYSQDKKFSSRALFPFDTESRMVEFYEIVIEPFGEEVAQAHKIGTIENLVISEGEVEIEIEGKKFKLDERDSINFRADVPHIYRNTSSTKKAILYLVMIYK